MGQPRLLTVHAHADDESITMGGTLAVLADAGVRTCVVCCTDGQLATIVDPSLPEEETRPRLGELRREELRAACAALGVDEVRFLGRHDSGMAGAPSNYVPEAFWMEPLDGLVGELVAILRGFRPHVVVTYDAYGAYGHPDHIQTHRVTLLAVEAAHLERIYPQAGPPWRVSKLYYTATPRSQMRRAIELALAAGMPHPFEGREPEELEFACADELVTASLDVRAGLARRRQALLAHRSQISPDFPLVAMPDEVLAEVVGEDHYQLALSRVPVSPPETDLFAGIDLAAD